MRTWMATAPSLGGRIRKMSVCVAALLLVTTATALAQPAESTSGEASLKLPDLSQVRFLSGIDGH